MLGKNLIQAAAGNAGAAGGLGVEDIFSTWLYTGNGSTQTITNGIDLSGEGGLVWIKSRSQPYTHRQTDTLRGGSKYLRSEATNAEATDTENITSFNSDGFSIGSRLGINGANDTFASWTFRKAPGFFDVVTYTGTGVNRTIAHSLGSTPGTIIVKTVGSADNWAVYHRSLGATKRLWLNFDASESTGSTFWNNTEPTSSVFSVGTNGATNGNGLTYVAYLFAHDEQIFGETGDQSVIKCGSFTATTTWGNFKLDLGWEPQFVLYKRTNGSSDWQMLDSMRGVVGPGDLALSDSAAFYTAFSTSDDAVLLSNLSQAESLQRRGSFYSQGFLGSTGEGGGAQYIYIAIRRGPMKTPTSGTEVFAMDTLGGIAPNPPGFNSSFPVDMGWYKYKLAGGNWFWATRLLSGTYLRPTSTVSEASDSSFSFDYQDGWFNSTSVASDYPGWMFRRAPGFFDVVAYTGTGVARTVSHNLGVAPELMIVKRRNLTEGWQAYVVPVSPSSTLELNTTNGAAAYTNRWDGASTATEIKLLTHASVNASGSTYIAYLFATLSGISKVGSYTGTGTTQQINCGFTSGARFVLIKRTDSTGDWYVWDTARGIVSGNDPYLLLNSTAAEVTSTDYIDPYSAGFEISSTAPAAINASGGTYIYLAIA